MIHISMINNIKEDGYSNSMKFRNSKETENKTLLNHEQVIVITLRFLLCVNITGFWWMAYN